MDDKVAEVCGIAGCTDAQARFFLESAAGDVAGAVTAYFGAPPPPHPVDRMPHTPKAQP